jgi:glycerol uptake facilitator-like aquaporin
MDKNVRAYVAELVGTFALVFVSAGAVCANYMAAVAWQPHPNPPEYVIVQPQPGLLGIALAAGCVYAVALAITLPFSTGYLNPAIPLMLWVFKRLDGVKTFALIAVQLVGALAAGGLLRLIFGFRADVLTEAHLGAPHLNVRAFGQTGVTPGVLLSGIGLELALTFVLTFALFALFLDPRVARWMGQGGRRTLACLAAGLVLVAATLVGFPLTGAALNPARWFGPVMWELTIPSLSLQRPFADQVVFWFGPIAGALLAGLVYTAVILPADETVAPGVPVAGGKTSAPAAATLFRSKK